MKFIQQSKRISMQNMNIKIPVYLIDSIKIDSHEHRALRVFQNSSFQYFSSPIAIVFNEAKKDYIDIYGTQPLSSFSVQFYPTESMRLKASFQLLISIWYLHQKQYFTGVSSLQQIIVADLTSKKIRLKAHKAIKIGQYTFPEPKKQKSIGRNGIELCLQVKKIPEAVDIWKWSVFTAQLLFQFSLQAYIEKVITCDKISEFIPQVKIKNEFYQSGQLLKLVTSCLSPDPQKRPQIEKIIPAFQKIIRSINTSLPELANKVENLYMQRQSSIKSQFQISITQDILLTQELKKKLIFQFNRLSISQKPPKAFKPLYRATRFQFNTRVFYEQCSKKSKLLFIFETKDYGIICFYFQPTLQAFESFGAEGCFIADNDLKSFIFSLKNQQSYKILSKQKAYKSVPGKGPIIGDGDLIVTEDPNRNFCNFPRSYQTGRSKQLLPKQEFTLKNYDVYMVIF